MTKRLFYSIDITQKQIADLLRLLRAYEESNNCELPETLADIKYQLLDVIDEDMI